MRRITLGHLNINAQGKKYVNDALDSNRLSRGKYTEQLEAMFAKLHESKYAVFMNSGTSALQVALAALKEEYHYRDGDEVIVPAMTFIASSNVIIQNNLKPVFVDVDPDTFNIDVDKIKEAITKKTCAILPVHLFGLPAEMPSIRNIANRNCVQVLEDSCEAMFSRVAGHTVGSWGEMACFSNYVAHFIVGGVGGLITTNNQRLAELSRSFMAHGRDSIYLNIDDDDKVDNDIIERRYSFERVGYSYRATELEAAIALSELEMWKHNIFIRQESAWLLTRLLTDLQEYLQLPIISKDMTHSFMMYAMVCKAGVDRADLLLHLEHNGIETRYMLPLLGQPIYRKLFPGEYDRHPVAKNLTEKGFFIGIHQGLSVDDILYVSDVIHDYFRRKHA